MFGVVDDSTTTKFVNCACAVHGISLPVVVNKAVVVVLKFPIVDKGFFLVDYRQPKLSINKKLIRVVSYCVILNMAVNIKDLYGNSGNRLKKIKYSLEFSIKKTLYLIYLEFFAFVWLRFLSTPCFRTSKKSLISIGSGK